MRCLEGEDVKTFGDPESNDRWDGEKETGSVSIGGV